MRLPLACALVLVAACGRLGYEEVPDAAGDGPGSDGPDAPIDGPDPGIMLDCEVATELLDFGDTGGTSAPAFTIDVARTDAGFLVVWNAGGGNVWVTAFALEPGPRIVTLQTMQHVVFEEGPGFSISSIGNAAMLGVNDASGTGTHLFALDHQGFERSSSKYIEDHHAFGHDFVVADPAGDYFVAMASTGTAVAAFTRDHDIHPRTGPVASFAVTTESAAAVPMTGGGYTLISGNSTNCNVGITDGALAPIGTSQTLAMTCHNASIVKSVDSEKVVAGWNCDNDDVWATGGDATMTLPAFHAISDIATKPAANPRLAAADPGIWYAWRVGNDRIARALVDHDSAVVAGGEPAVKHMSADLKAYDLSTNGTYGFLFWIEVQGPSTKMFTMKLCPP